MPAKLLFILLFLLSASLFAQTGTVKGLVQDAASKEGLIGASVLLEGTSLGGAADVNGNFIINKVPAGTYTAVVTFVGYNTKKIPGIVVEPAKITLLNTALDDEGQQLQEVTITASRQTNTTVAVISEIREAQQVVSGISAEQIVRSQDRDAAEVVRRIPGVTIVDNRFINIRGLNERYNTVWLNDAVAPSSETDRKSFSFDIIPSNLLDRVLIFKTPSPELPGDFAGGMVKVYTRRPSYNERSLSVSASESFRVGTTFSGFTSDKKQNLDWLGFGYNDRKLPTAIPDASGNIPAVQSRQFSNTYPLTSKTAIPDQRLNISYLTGFKIGEKSFGSLTALTYTNTFTTFDINRLDVYRENVFNQDVQSTNNVKLGGLQNFVFSLGNGGKLEFRNMFNQISRNQVTERNTFDTNGENQTSYSYSMGYQSRQTYNGQLAGLHNIAGGLSIDWVLGYASSNKKEPDLRRTKYGAQDQRAILPRSGVDLFSGSRLYQDLSENIYSLNLGLKQKFGESFELSAGTYIESKKRTFNARLLGYSFSSTDPGAQGLLNQPIRQIFDPQNVDKGLNFSEDGASVPSPIAPDVKPNYSYDAANDLAAGYLSANLTLGKFKALGGARFEHNVQSILAGLQSTKIDESITTDKILPSVNLSYNITEKALVRAAYGRTLNRPEFREWAPFVYYDFDINALTYGSLYLPSAGNGTPGKPLQVADIDNFDLRYEYYPSEGENVHVGVFYKKFANPIEASISNNPSNLAFTFINAPSAYAAGIEVDVRKKLNFLGSAFLENFTVVFNGSLIKSEVDVDEKESWTPKRKLQGQSPYVANLGLYYQTKNWQFSGLYNVFGPRIVFVGSGATQYSEIVELPRHTVDITVTRNIIEKLSINAGVSDLLNQRVLYLQDSPGVLKNDKNDADNSGVLSYVRIEWAGVALSPNNEINGLSLYAVGSGTTIDHVQVSFANDDSIEWFGGTVNLKYLLCWRGIDDDFDTDNGYSGNVQFGVGVRDLTIADQSGSKGFESDNDGNNSTNLPQTLCVFSNMTLVGPTAVIQSTTTPAANVVGATTINPNAAAPSASFVSGIHVRRNTALSTFNSVIIGWPAGVLIDANTTAGNIASGKLVMKNNIVGGNLTGTVNGVSNSNRDILYLSAPGAGSLTAINALGPDSSAFGATTGPVTYWQSNSNRRLRFTADFQLTNPFEGPALFDVTPKAGSPALTGAAYTDAKLQNPFFDKSPTFVGAVGGTSTNFLKESWIKLDVQNIVYQ